MQEPQEPQNALGATNSWQQQQDEIKQVLPQRQQQRSPKLPRLLLAQYTEDTVTVYQAYRDSIAEAAVRNGNFADSDFSFRRMTWIKPNFSWMMHRSGWASNPGQERVLAIRLWRQYFDSLLQEAIASSWAESSFDSKDEWHRAMRKSNVVVQWDPDHHLLNGARLPYRVLQLGIRKQAMDGFRGPGISSIVEITDDVERLRAEIMSHSSSNPRSITAATPLEVRYSSVANQRLGVFEV